MEHVAEEQPPRAAWDRLLEILLVELQGLLNSLLSSKISQSRASPCWDYTRGGCVRDPSLRSTYRHRSSSPRTSSWNPCCTAKPARKNKSHLSLSH